jgi:hypothetical protein
MKRLIYLCFLFSFSNLGAQSLTGVYLPINHFSFKSIFGKIPSYEYLSIKSDLTYYHESFWGSFLDKDSGFYKVFDDTLILYNIVIKNDIKFIDRSITALKSDSLSGKLKIRIIDKRGQGLEGIHFDIYSGSSKNDFQTDKSGSVYTNFIKYDSIVIKHKQYLVYPINKITPELHNQNDYSIELEILRFVVKKDNLYNLKGEVVAKKKIDN